MAGGERAGRNACAEVRAAARDCIQLASLDKQATFKNETAQNVTVQLQLQTTFGNYFWPGQLGVCNIDVRSR